jgi:hypothetical protein
MSSRVGAPNANLHRTANSARSELVRQRETGLEVLEGAPLVRRADAALRQAPSASVQREPANAGNLLVFVGTEWRRLSSIGSRLAL